jgi:hypothetical protein
METKNFNQLFFAKLSLKVIDSKLIPIFLKLIGIFLKLFIL